MNKGTNKIIAVFFLATCSFFSSLTAYDWQSHVPDWQSHVPDWQEFIPHHENSSGQTFYGPVTKVGYQSSGMTVYGPLSLTDSYINGSLTLYGPVFLEKTVVEGLITLYGIINISNSSIKNLRAWTTEVHLMNSNADSIFIGKDDHKRGIVYLEGATKITGSIIFEQGNGVVIAAPTSEFFGQVIGGAVIRK